MELRPSIKRIEANITISIQAQKVLKNTKYTVEDLVAWRLTREISVGGSEVIIFLEQMHDKNLSEEVK